MEEACYQGRIYVYNGYTWYDKKSFQVPSRELQSELSSITTDNTVTISPDESSQELYRRAVGAEEAGVLSQAKRLVEAALRRDQKNVDAACLYSRLLLQMQRPQEALRATEGSLEQTAELQLARSRALFGLGRFSEAEAIAQRILVNGDEASAGQASSVLEQVGQRMGQQAA